MLWAILWGKAHMSHLESSRLKPREDSLQPRRRKVDESAHLDRQYRRPRRDGRAAVQARIL